MCIAMEFYGKLTTNKQKSPVGFILVYLLSFRYDSLVHISKKIDILRIAGLLARHARSSHLDNQHSHQNEDQNSHAKSHNHPQAGSLLLTAVLTTEAVVAHAHTTILITTSLVDHTMRLALIILEIGITLQAHAVVRTAAMTITHLHIMAGSMTIAVAIGCLRALLIALVAEETRLAVITASALVKVVSTNTVASSVQTTVTLAIVVAGLTGLTLQAEVTLHAVHTLALRTPSLVALALTRSLNTGITCAMVASRARRAVLSEESRKTVLALSSRIKSLLITVLAHTIGASDRNLEFGVIVLLLLTQVVDANVVVAVITPPRMIMRKGDIRQTIARRTVRPEMVLDRCLGGGRHVDHDIGSMFLDALDVDGDGAVGLLVEVEVGIDAVRVGLEVTSTRDIGAKDERSYP